MAIARDFRDPKETRPGLGRLLLAMLLAIAAVVVVAFEHGYHEPLLHAAILEAGQLFLPWLSLVVAGDIHWRRASRTRWSNPVGVVGECGLAAAALTGIMGLHGPAELLSVAAAVTMALRLNSQLARSISNPSLLFPASFLGLITVSTFLLKLPSATPDEQPINWVDAAFTATSAVCVTGLAVRDTATGFTPFGQAVIAASIQLGGLGVMIFGSTLALLFGARLSFRENVTLSMALDEYPAHRITRFAWFIVLVTLGLEAIGALILYVTWPAELIRPGDHRLWLAVFHSISAFCNAGFDITGESLIGLRAHGAPYFAIVPLIIIGGLGFIVLEDFHRLIMRRHGRRRVPRLSTHTRLVLATTAALLILGFVVILIAQARAAGQFTGQHVLDALFMSTTARTAGFTSMPMDELTPGSRFMLMLLMSVGGSPGSTAGGMKTTVFAVLVLSIISTVRGRDEVEAFGRALPDGLVKRAGTIAFGLVGVVSLAALALDLTETIRFEPLLFEVISAATTTGLSLGATDDLTPAGRIIIVATMFLGRVGPLALLASLVGMHAPIDYRLPRDTVSLG
ncbi:MAG: hypothetical protein KDA21_04140 [Phycisphaerales bacterium]|nr:hypothetical protein [Phycisphaerales bacterium]